MSLTELTGNPRHDQLLTLIADRGYMNIDELAQLPTIVGVAGGEEKADAIYAALKGRRINGLVTEETTARAVLALT